VCLWMPQAMPSDSLSLDIAPAELALPSSRNGCAILDVRESWEVAICGLPGAIHLPLDDLIDRAESLPHDRVLVVVRHADVRSLIGARHVRASGFERVTSLRGGLRRLGGRDRSGYAALLTQEETNMNMAGTKRLRTGGRNSSPKTIAMGESRV
jgi:rhodanese-related sulfurtransferase